jgi:transcription antitermination factor NusG
MTASPDHLPAQLYPQDILYAPPNGALWRVAQTRSRREKKLACYLAEHDIGYYLPLLKRRQAGQKRNRYSFVPAFGNYVFIKAGDNERHQIIRSHHVARMIEVQDQARLIKELRQLQTVLVMEEKVYPYDYITQGQQVRIVEGPLRGIEGIVEKKKSGYRLVLSVSSLFQAVAMDIDAQLVEPVQSRLRRDLRQI